MPIRLAINGFGRIGRAALKIALDRGGIDIVAINDLAQLENLAYLLRYDTVYGRCREPVVVGRGELRIGPARIKVFSEKNPGELPWRDIGADVVIESTGAFTTEAGARQHLTAGAKRVIISAPTGSETVPTIVLGVNNEAGVGQAIVSLASCTTNCAAPIIAILDTAFGIDKAILTTAHAYTSTQEIVDGPAGDDFRRGRAAALNIIPSSTGAAKAATKAYQSLAGKFDGISLRVPVGVVSISDIVALLKADVTVTEVNDAFRQAAGNLLYRGIIGVTDDPVVSRDFIGDSRSAIVDLQLTRVVGDNLVKVMAWYDNEWAYASRLIDQVLTIGPEL